METFLQVNMSKNKSKQKKVRKSQLRKKKEQLKKQSSNLSGTHTQIYLILLTK